MLDILRVMESLIVPRLLRGAGWKGLLLSYYHKPVMEVVWTSFGEYGVDLYKVNPCKREEASFYVYLMPFSAKILSGVCGMDVGYGEGEEEPAVVCQQLILTEGSCYSALYPEGWYRIYPVDKPAMIMAIAGSPWGRSSHSKGEFKKATLPREKEMEILGFFRNYYPRSEIHWTDDFKRYVAEALKMGLEDLEKALACNA